jgi:hypothetical protein
MQPPSTRVTPSDSCDWEARIAACWETIDTAAPDTFVGAIDALAAERGDDDPAALFERAAARDSTGFERAAEALYRRALASGGLDAYRRARATLQLASTLRILGQLDESERLLRAERSSAAADPTYPLADELAAIFALTLVAQGRADEAAAIALLALAPHLSRYRRSVAANATALLAACRR